MAPTCGEGLSGRSGVAALDRLGLAPGAGHDLELCLRDVELVLELGDPGDGLGSDLLGLGEADGDGRATPARPRRRRRASALSLQAAAARCCGGDGVPELVDGSLRRAARVCIVSTNAWFSAVRSA